MAKKALRFGLGWWDGLRSAAWRVWAGSDGSVYVTTRDHPHFPHVSLPRDPERPGGEWRIHVDPSKVQVASGDLKSRTMAAWDSEASRLGDGPIRQGFAVVLGRFSLGYHQLPTDVEKRKAYEADLSKVKWLTDLPPVDQAWQYTVLIGDEGADVGPVGTRAMKAAPKGHIVTATGAHVWLMRHQIPVSPAMHETLRDAANRMAQHAAPDASEPAFVLRGGAWGWDDEPALRWMIDLAVTRGIPDEAMALIDALDASPGS